MKYIEYIDEHKARIITGTQIEMEYKKNRQKVILETLGQFKTPQWHNLSVPALLSESKEATEIEKLKQSISEQQKKINNNIENLLKDPLQYDPVFTSLNTLFSNHSNYNLHKGHSENIQITEKALGRFMHGYPPTNKPQINQINQTPIFKNQKHTDFLNRSLALVVFTSRFSDELSLP